MHVAEQVSIGRPPDAVVALLRQRSAAWLQPFLLLAWNDGEAALRRVGRAAVPVPAATAAAGSPTSPYAASAPPYDSARSDHHLRLSEPTCRPSGTTAFGLVWTVDAPTMLFRRLRGGLMVEPFGDGAVLGLRAAVVAEGDPGSPGTALRPVELVVRSLLGHIRTALE